MPDIIDEIPYQHAHWFSEMTECASREDVDAFVDRISARLREAERKARAFDAIRELFDRFDTRFGNCRDQVLLTDDLLERTRDAIESALAAGKETQ